MPKYKLTVTTLDNTGARPQWKYHIRYIEAENWPGARHELGNMQTDLRRAGESVGTAMFEHCPVILGEDARTLRFDGSLDYLRPRVRALLDRLDR